MFGVCVCTCVYTCAHSWTEWFISQHTHCHTPHFSALWPPTTTPFCSLGCESSELPILSYTLDLGLLKLPREVTDCQVQVRKSRLKEVSHFAKTQGVQDLAWHYEPLIPLFLPPLPSPPSYIVRLLNFAMFFLTFRTLYLLFIPFVWTQRFPFIPSQSASSLP